MNARDRGQVKPYFYGMVLFVLLAVWTPAHNASASSSDNHDRLAASIRSQSFQQGQAHWQLTWNEWTGTARSGIASHGPVGRRVGAEAALQSAEAFLKQHATALGVGAVQLRRVRHRFSGQVWLTTWVQESAGVTVVDAYVDLTLRADGAPIAFRSSLLPHLVVRTGSGTVERSQEISRKSLGGDLRVESTHPCIVVPRTGMEGIAADETFLSNESGGRWRVRVSRVDGAILEVQDLIRTQTISGSVSGKVSPRYFREDQVESNLPWLQVFQSSDVEGPSTFTDRDGFFSLAAPLGSHELHADLAGRFVRVANQAGAPAPHVIKQVASPGNTELVFNTLNSRADERTIYFHTNYVHDQFKDRFDFDLLDFAIPALANASDPSTGDPNFPNAYWNGLLMGFGNGGGTFFNMGQHADVIYHEYTHAVTDYIYRPIGGLNYLMGASMHEALSDYFSASFTEDPLLGDRLLRDRTPYLRRIDELRVWPDDMDTGFRADVHSNGLILAGALWDLRTQLGADIVDPLAHYARELFPLDYEEYVEAMLLQDDVLFGDAIPGNGSPNHDTILLAFGRHGLGSLGTGSLSILHAPLSDSEETNQPRLVRARLASVHAASEQRAMRLLWSNGGPFAGLWMQPDASGEFVASIPAQPNGTTVRYYFTALQLPPVITAVLPAMAPDHFFEYSVGADEQAPTIVHVPIVQHAAFTGAPQIQAALMDRGGIDYAWFEYRLDNGTEGVAGLVRQDLQSDTFTGVLPIALAVGRSFQYRIHAVDRSLSAHHSTSPANGWHDMTIVENLFVDFESHDGGWSHQALLIDRADEWHLSSATNHTNAGSQAWHCQTASAPGQSVAAVLVTPVYELGQSANASVWSWIRAAENENGAVDAGQVQIQVDGCEWQALMPVAGYSHQIDRFLLTNYLPPQSPCLSGSDSAWRQLTFDLTAYAGKAVRLRFLFASAAPVLQETSEWFLDDFALQPGSPISSDVTTPGAPALRLLRQEPAPNPFNPAVVFILQAEEDLEAVRLEIHDAQGRRVRRLLEGPLIKGEHRSVWDGRNAQGLASASGVYYYLLESGLGRQTGKLVLLK